MQDEPLVITIDGSGLTGTKINQAAHDLGVFARHGLDPRGEIVGLPPKYYANQQDVTGQLVNDPQLDAHLAKLQQEEEAKARWTTTPREIIREGSAPLFTSTTPDVALTPRGSATPPIPYSTTARPVNPQNFTPSVKATGQSVMVLRSREMVTTGAEQGVALGVVSGTINGPVDPLNHSSTVRAEGSFIIRDKDVVWMNNRNNLGVAQLTGSQATVTPATAEAPPEEEPGFFDQMWDGAKDAWQSTKDMAGEAAQAVADFDAAHGRVLTRGVGVVQAVGGAAEAVLGAGMVGVGGAATPTGVGTAPGLGAIAVGGALWVNGWDNAWTGLQTAWHGEFQHNLASQAAGGIASAMGASPQTVEQVMNAGDLASGALSIGGGIAAGTRATGREALEAASRSVDEVAEATAEQTGRVTRPVPKRLQYLGKTPGKSSKTGREVRERMRREGDLKYDPDLGEDVFKAEDGNWYPVDRPNVHMGHHPVDAVDWWNSTGRQYGARSPEVRQWMLDSNNYRFEYGPLNSARGGATTSTYLDPIP
ncbi:MAG: DUF4150 domain-containing protein [Gemmobacter sp.]|uniref:PAAR-like domain-containing protein n=1 Tax=Gemmobacter sp. TaxID=1898957 RepID=UPI001A3E88C3|nr:PAAR-like domain-containing protein [Gemmobacter sp.]MBL8561901.1 DUF4150 domain-containing protein [Gemmobacter sp.]